ncbi:MAG TPA: aldo/keto reductase, partial [Chitinophagaceae bacterium]|nr:aldo/keto reductase [Chitinophagaceae bacterium]
MTQLSPVIAGCMKWGQWGVNYSTAQYLKLVEDCIANKITSFDHADIYGDYTVEEEFGNALKQKPNLRQQMQLITKCGIRRYTSNRPAHRISSYDTSKTHIITSAETSLKNLNTDYIDLLLIHRPDPLMHPHIIAEAFSQLKQTGKVLHFGVSNFTPSQMDMMMTAFKVEFNQFEVSILHLDPFHDGTLDKCIQHNIRPMSWGPLGSGRLFADTRDERNKRIVAVATILAEKYNVSADQILLAFLFKHPSGIIPVIGSTKIERLKLAYD